MNIKFLKIALLFFSLFLNNALAENLKFVGLLDPIGMKIYADKDSVLRRAHITQLNLVLITMPSSQRDEKIPFYFDCDEKTYHLPNGEKLPINTPVSWTNSGNKYSMSGNTITNIFEVACKKAYEFWK